ncbi:hypothetical protein J6590_005098 [Homalodisca vitripennis]|nr:hypothetical protein J6590_005098 [Homalodisca vitripennis]
MFKTTKLCLDDDNIVCQTGTEPNSILSDTNYVAYLSRFISVIKRGTKRAIYAEAVRGRHGRGGTEGAAPWRRAPTFSKL